MTRPKTFRGLDQFFTKDHMSYIMLMPGVASTPIQLIGSKSVTGMKDLKETDLSLDRTL